MTMNTTLGKMGTRPIYLLLPAIVLLLMAFWLRVEDLDTFPPGISYDETTNVLMASHIAQGGTYPIFQIYGEPEPGYQIASIGAGVFFGQSVFTYRLHSTFWGLLSVAAAYGATLQLLHDRPRWQRHLAGLVAGGVLAASLGHITLSRALYRAIPQPFFMLMFVAFFARALRSNRYRDYLLAGLSLGGTIYFYTSGLLLPAVLIPAGLMTLILNRDRWRETLPRLVATGVAAGAVMLPLALALLTSPELIATRAGDVSGPRRSLSDFIDITWQHLIVAGDPNAQYNTATAPLIAAMFVPLFLLGFVTLAVRVLRPTTTVIVGFLVLAALVPAITAEPIHGLRAIGLYGAFPVVVGLGAALILRAGERVLRNRSAWILAALLFVIVAGALSRSTYRDYFIDPPRQARYQYDLPVAEWYFRSDLTAFGEWMIAQERPVLVPLWLMATPQIRSGTLADRPYVDVVDADYTLPDDALWATLTGLGAVEPHTSSAHYAMVTPDSVVMLPPFDDATVNRLAGLADDAQAIPSDVTVQEIGVYADLPDDLSLTYLDGRRSEDPLAAFDDDTLVVKGWRGDDTISSGRAGESLRFFVDWSLTRRTDLLYETFVQVQSQAHENLGFQNPQTLYWGLYPTTRWQPGETITHEYAIPLQRDLEPGAYRLVAGAKTFWGDVDAVSWIEHQVPSSATIAWLKVPQRETVGIPATARAVDVTFDDMIRLVAVEVTQAGDTLEVDLYWEATVDRPNVDATIFVHLDTPDQPAAVTSDSRPWGGQYPTFIWDAGEVVRTTHTLSLTDLQPNDLTLLAGMYTFPSLERLQAMQNGEPATDNRVNLGPLADLLADD